MSYLVRNAKRAKAHTAETPSWQVQRDTERGVVLTEHRARGGKGISTVEVLRAFCDVNNRQLDWADQYGEPGYTTPAKGILFADWNDVSKPLQKRLEAQGFELEWSDEWDVDSDRSPSKAWRTQPDGHGWESRVRCTDGDMLTPDDDAQEWIDDALNEERRPLPSWFDESELQLRGFAVIEQDDKEVGLHPGQNETPDKFMPALIKEGYDVVLQITDRSQFDTRYKVWTRREAKQELFLSDARGQYIPRDFAVSIDRDRITGVELSQLDALAKGPPHGLDSEGDGCEDYWDIWSDVLDKAEITDSKGIVLRLEQDGDLWLVETAGEFCEHEGKYYVHK